MRIFNISDTVLDQYVSNFPIFKKNIEILPPLPNCDHCVITAKIYSLKFKNPNPMPEKNV